jgi:predicted nucleic acid-binding protein
VALIDLSDLVVFRHGHLDLAGRVFDLRAAMTAYDATYVALAEALSARLVTCDRKLGRAVGHSAQIEVIQ